MKDARFGLLCIGNELLSGKVPESNLSFWIEELSALGRKVSLALICRDEREDMLDAIAYLRARCDILFMSGGIGPTHDDLTLPVLAEALGRPLQRDERLVRAIHTHYGAGVNEHLLSMADLPQGTELLYWDELVVPLFRVDDIYVFPGAPELLRAKFRLLARDWSPTPLYVHKLYTRFDEGEIAAQLARIERDFEGVAVGSYPRYTPNSDYSVMVTVECRDRGLLQAALEALCDDEFRSGVLRECSGPEAARAEPGSGARAEG